MTTLSRAPRSARFEARRFPARRRSMLASTALGAALLLWQTPLHAGPDGERVVAGQALVTRPNAGTTLVNQSSQSVLIDWQNFSIAANETVRFQQPNQNALAINRVTGSQISNIFGSLLANGNVALINPAGIIIHNGATIDVGGLVVSAHRLSDDDARAALASGRIALGQPQGGAGDVSNSGSITVREGGLAALTGGRVANKGTITATLGKVSLAAGEVVTVDLAGDGLVRFAASQPEGKASGAKVENSGTIAAARVELSVAQAARVVDQSINMSGIIRATSAQRGAGGTIILGGGSGGVRVSGKLDASSDTAKGGRVEVTGKKVELEAAIIDASGATGGGSVRIGGGYQGGEDIARAQTTSVDAKTIIDVSARESGDGGSAVVWSDERTSYAGQILATGGALSGDGGKVEVSGKQSLGFKGGVDTHAVHGKTGTLLLDPYNMLIIAGEGGAPVAAADDSTIGAKTLVNLLANNNVEVTTGAGGTQAGDIIVYSSLSWASANTLTLTAAGKITVLAGITAEAGSLVITSGEGRDVLITASQTLKTLTVNSGGKLAINKDITIKGTGADVLILNFATKSLKFGAPGQEKGTFELTSKIWLGADATSVKINNESYTVITTPRGLNTVRAGVTGKYVLGDDLDMSGRDFSAIGDPTDANDVAKFFTGKFEGFGHSIYNIETDRSRKHSMGFFGYLSGATISHLTLSNILIDGGTQGAGALAGIAVDSGIFNVRVTSGQVVSDAFNVGGLIGSIQNTGVVQGYSMADALGIDATNVGGLIGLSSGGSKISESFSDAVAKGGLVAGGLIGRVEGADASVTDSYASGEVIAGKWIAARNRTESEAAGGLIGLVADGITVRDSYASGSVRTRGVKADGTAPSAGVLIGSGGNLILTDTWSSGAANDVRPNDPSAQTEAGLNAKSLEQLGFVDTTWQKSRTGEPLLKWNPVASRFLIVGTTNGPGGSVAVFANEVSYGGRRDVHADGTFIFRYDRGDFVAGIGLLLSHYHSTDRAQYFTQLTGARTYSDIALQSGALIVNNYSKFSDVGAAFEKARGVWATYFADEMMPMSWSNKGDLKLDNYKLIIVNSGSLTIDRDITVPSLVLKTGDKLSISGNINLTGSGNDVLVVNYVNNSFSNSDGSKGTFELTSKIDLPNAETVKINGVTYNVINDVSELTGIGTDAGKLAKNYVLGSDLDLSSEINFTTLGALTGNFDGFNHLLSKLTITRLNTPDVGLFSSLQNTMLVRLNITGAIIKGGSQVGILAGRLVNSFVYDVDVKGSLEGGEESGGVAGKSTNSTLRNVTSDAVVSGSTNIGGLVGTLDGGLANRTYATGNVTGSGNLVGGLVGNLLNGAKVTESYANGDVRGINSVGGLIGQMSGGELESTFAWGTVHGQRNVGGLIGATDLTPNIRQSYASGAVTGTDTNSSASLIGLVKATGLVISNSFATASATAAELFKKAAGVNDPTLTNSRLFDDATFLTKSLSDLGFSAAWKKDAGDYPVLAWNPVNASFTITGTSDVAGTLRFYVSGREITSLVLASAGSFTLKGRGKDFASGGLLVTVSNAANGVRENFITALVGDKRVTDVLLKSDTLTIASVTNASSAGRLYLSAVGGLDKAANGIIALDVSDTQLTLASGRLSLISLLSFTVDRDIVASNVSVKGFGPLYVNKIITATGDVELGNNCVTTAGANGETCITRVDAAVSGGKVSISGARVIINKDVSATNAGEALIINTGTAASLFAVDTARRDATYVTIRTYELNALINLPNATSIKIDGGSYNVLRTAQDVQNMNTNLNGRYVLGADIDLQSIANFTPIGTLQAPFRGRFDGLGHRLRNLTVNVAGSAGLFGATDRAVLSHLRLDLVNVTSTAGDAGGLAGIANNSGIYDVFVSGRVQGQTAGGAVGQSMIGDFVRLGTDVTVTGTQTAGGLIGAGGSLLITESFAIGDVTSMGSDTSRAGGLVGWITPGNIWAFDTTADGSEIVNSFSWSLVRAKYAAGGLVGEFQGLAGLTSRIGARILNSISKGDVYAAKGGTIIGVAAGAELQPDVWNLEILRTFTTSRVNQRAGNLVGFGSGGSTGASNTVDPMVWGYIDFGANSDASYKPEWQASKPWVAFEEGEAPVLSWMPQKARWQISGNSDVAGLVRLIINGEEKASYQVGAGDFMLRPEKSLFKSGALLVTVTGGSAKENFVTTVKKYTDLVDDVVLKSNTLTINGISKTSEVRALWDAAKGALNPDDYAIMPLTFSEAGDLTLASGRLSLISQSDFTVDRKINSEFFSLKTSKTLVINSDITLSGAGNDVLSLDYGTDSVSNADRTKGTFELTSKIELANADAVKIKGANYVVINSVADLKAIGIDPGKLALNYVLGTDLDLSGEANFTQLGTLTGNFDGLNHTIRKLTISRADADQVGLFQMLNGNVFVRLNLRQANVQGRNGVGLLAGGVNNAFLYNVTAEGVVRGVDTVGGLLGSAINSTLIIAKTDVTLQGMTKTGGLIGVLTNSTLSRGAASGSVTGADYAGGLIAIATQSTISESLSETEVVGAARTGGFIGSGNMLTISESYSRGNVTGTDMVGGFIGDLSNGNTEAAINVMLAADGNLTELQSRSTIKMSYSSGNVRGTTAKVGTFVGVSLGNIYETVYATGSVNGAAAPRLIGQFLGDRINSASKVMTVAQMNSATITSLGFNTSPAWDKDVNYLPNLIRNSSLSTFVISGYSYLKGTLNFVVDGRLIGTLMLPLGNSRFIYQGKMSDFRAGTLLISASDTLDGAKENYITSLTGDLKLEGVRLENNTLTFERVSKPSDAGAMYLSAVGALNKNTYGIYNLTVANDSLTLASGRLRINSPGDLTVDRKIISEYLTLTALGKLAINQDISLSGTKVDILVLSYNNFSLSDKQKTKGTYELTATINFQNTGMILINDAAYRVITDVSQIQAAAWRINLWANFVLGADIDMAGISDFAPIGNETDNFTGKFDGFGHTIKNLTFDASTRLGGLFGWTNGSIISHLKLSGALVSLSGTGTAGNASYAGIVVGRAENTSLFDVEVDTSEVRNTRTVEAAYAGGLIGYASNSILVNTSATIKATGSHVGGLAGYFGGLIVRSYSEGEVIDRNVAANQRISGGNSGGLVGITYGGTEIQDSYSWARVSGGNGAGGLIGQSGYQTVVTRSYATGDVTGGNYSGALIGFATDGGRVANRNILTNVYASGRVNGATGNLVGGGTPLITNSAVMSYSSLAGKTLAELGLSDTIWDRSTFTIAPVLKWSSRAFFTVSGTSEVKAGTLRILVNGAEYGNVSINSDGSFYFRGSRVPFGTDKSLLLTLTGGGGALENWGMRITQDTRSATASLLSGRLILNADTVSLAGSIFADASGSLDKTAYGIMPLTVLSAGLSLATGRLQIASAGLLVIDRHITSEFLTLTSPGKLAVNKDIVVNGAGNDVLVLDYVTDSFTSSDGTKGSFELTSKIDLTNAETVKVKGVSYLVINTIDELKSLGVDASKLSKNYVLGLDLDLASEANFTRLGSFTGMLDGFNHTLRNLKMDRPTINRTGGGTGLFEEINGKMLLRLKLAAVNLSGANDVGALAARLVNGFVYGVSVDGSVLGLSRIGGIIGNATGGELSNVSSDAQVRAMTTAVGGVLGNGSGVLLFRTSAFGKVTGGGGAGGLAGLLSNNSRVRESYAQGDVEGTIDVGGLIGNIAGGEVSNSFAWGAVNGRDHVGGLIGGISLTPIIRQTYATGAVTTTTLATSASLIGYIANAGVTLTNSFASGALNGGTAVLWKKLATVADPTPVNSLAFDEATLLSKSLATLAFEETIWQKQAGEMPVLKWSPTSLSFTLSGTTDATSGKLFVYGGGKELGSIDVTGNNFSIKLNGSDVKNITDLLLVVSGKVGADVAAENLLITRVAGKEMGGLRLTQNFWSADGGWTRLSEIVGAWNGAKGALQIAGLITFANVNDRLVAPQGINVSIKSSNALDLDLALSLQGALRIASNADITVSRAISTSLANRADALVLVAGADDAAGLSTGGDIKLAAGGSLVVAATSGGRLYSGSVSGTTGFDGLASGNRRYKSNEGTSNYTRALAATGLSLIYREAASLNAAGESSYDGTSGRSASFNGESFALVGKQNGTAAALQDAGSYSVISDDARAVGLTVSDATYVIKQKEITISGITASNKVYDGGTTATLTYGGVQFGGKVGSDVLTITATGAFDDKNVGTGKKVTLSGLTLGGADVRNYVLKASGQQTEASANITAKEIVVSGITASNKTYDGTTGVTLVVNAASFDGKLAADSLSVSGNGAFDNKNVGSNKKVTISNLVLAGTDARNYVLKASGQQTETSANVSAKEVTVSGITASNKTYDGGTVATLVVNAANFDGKLADDTLTVSGTGAFADKDVGANKKVTISDLVLSGADANNYVLKGSGQQTETTASITAKEIVISGISASNKTYDGDTAATLVLTSVTLGGKLGSDTLSITATGAFENKNAGSNKKVTISSLTLGGTDAKNYVLKASGQQSETSATILRKEVTVSGITAGDKTYDGGTVATLIVNSAAFDGKLAGDTLTITGTGAFADKDVGADKKVTISNLALGGADANNYVLKGSGQQTETTASITAREITISGITASNKTYDGGTTATLTYSGVQFGGKLGTDVLTITATGEFADKDVGTNKKVSLTALTLAGTDAKNYVLKGSGQQSETSASITAREIVVSGITANNKTYDGTTNVTLVVSSASFGGKLANDTLSVSATGAFDSKDAGSDKRVMIGSLSLGGTDARNYVLKSSGQQTETRATIDQKEITVAGLKAQDKTYDGKVSASFDSSRATYSFKVASDDLGVAATGTFDDAGVGANKNASITSITLTGRDAGNYRLASSGQQVASTASIRAASLLVRVNDVDRDGDGRPFVGPYEVSYSGFVNGEGPSVLRGQLTFSGTGVTAAADGVYEVSASGLSSDNYVITYVAGTLTIGRTPVVESVQVARLPIIPVRSFVEKVPIIPVCQPMLFVSATTLPDDQQRLFAATSTVCQ